MRPLVLFLASMLLSAVPAWAQTGKIAGRVVERGTGEALIGVNVRLDGTSIGTVTDARGDYTILRVPPGVHTVVFTYVGFATTRIEGIEVGIDRTATLDVEMAEETLQGEEVVITAERPPVVRDLTGTATQYGEREVKAAPVEGVRGILTLTAGVDTNPDGTLSIRGGGAYDTQVLLNGSAQTMTNSGVPGYSFAFEKANNSWKYDFNPLGVGQIEVISGGFSAEYGNAQSGVVKVLTKEGTSTYEGDYRVEYRAPGQYHWGSYFYGEDNFEWEQWGSVEAWRAQYPDSSDAYLHRMHALWVSNHAPVYVAPDTVYTREGDVLYLPGERVENKLGVYDYRDDPYVRHLFALGGPLTGDGELLRFHLSGEVRDAPTRVPTVERVQRYRNVTLTTSFQPGGRHRFRLTNLYQYYRGGLVSGADDIRYAGREAGWKYTLNTDSEREEVTTTQTLGYTFAIDAGSYLEATLSHQYEQYRVPNLPVTQRTDPWSIPPGPWDAGYRTVFSFTTLYNQDARTHYYDAQLAYTAQLRQPWQVKVGAQFNRWDTEYNGVSAFVPNAFVARTGYGEHYTAQPTYAAAYVQNKLEFQGLVANIGLRLEGHNYHQRLPADRFNPFYQGLGAEAVGDPATVASETHARLSPRLGLSFPIGERTAFRLQYGHFSSMPQFRNALMRSTELGWVAYGNPNLRPERTVSFEVGVQRALFDGSYRLDVASYYNDRSDQVGLLRIQSPTGAIRRNKQYTTYANNAYSTSYGVEVTFERIAVGPWHYRLSYSGARTTVGSFGASTLYSDDPADPRNLRDRKSGSDILSYFDRTHRVRALATYTVPRGPKVLGVDWFSGASIGLIYRVQSGAPYTNRTDFSQFKDVVNNERYPFEEQFDLRIDKEFALGTSALLAGVRIDNLLNHRWITPIGFSEVLQDWRSSGVLRAEPTTTNVNQQPYYLYRNVPRQVFFSLGVRFR